MHVCFQSLDSVIQLKMRVEKGSPSEEDGSGGSSEQSEKMKWQTLSLQQLNDLQSKLMLVAGKALEGKEQVDRFVEVIEITLVVSKMAVRDVVISANCHCQFHVIAYHVKLYCVIYYDY